MAKLWSIFGDIWWSGAELGWTVWFSIMGLMLIAQLGWLSWRWINDSEKEEEEKRIDKVDRRRLIFGNLFNRKLFNNVTKDETEDFIFNIIIITNFIGAVVIGLWPFTIVVATIIGLHHLARGSVRLTKLVKRHDHDERYVRK